MKKEDMTDSDKLDHLIELFGEQYAKTSSIETNLHNLAKNIEIRLDQINKRFDKVDLKLEVIERRQNRETEDLDDHARRIRKLESKVDLI